LQDFIDNAPDSMSKAKYSAYRERSVGLGVMGFHSFLQSKMVPIESAMAKSWNLSIFKHIHSKANEASKVIATKKGACPDSIDAGLMERFTNKMAVAPTASISVIAGSSSPGIEPYNANCFTQKSLTGSFNIKNKNLKTLLQSKDKDTNEIWSSIMNHEGSVMHLDFLSNHEKDVFKTSIEINQKWLIEHAADRTPYICQSQSLNLFVSADIDKKELNSLHYLAWKRGVKSLYYCRSKSLQRADKVSLLEEKEIHQLDLKLVPKPAKSQESEYDECLSCQ
jgi:ribonucleoside-diphosphate reductase alpha chain